MVIIITMAVVMTMMMIVGVLEVTMTTEIRFFFLQLVKSRYVSSYDYCRAFFRSIDLMQFKFFLAGSEAGAIVN